MIIQIKKQSLKLSTEFAKLFCFLNQIVVFFTKIDFFIKVIEQLSKFLQKILSEYIKIDTVTFSSSLCDLSCIIE